MRKQLSIETIERGLKDSDCDVRAAAIKIAKAMGVETPPYRAIEPPELVFKKCVGDVIVVAMIPKDAEIRGSTNGKCRCNKAKIIEVIGTCMGENVGISKWDKRTTYFAGDDIEVEDFDYSGKECSTGFHFFCTRKEAEEH